MLGDHLERGAGADGGGREFDGARDDGVDRLAGQRAFDFSGAVAIAHEQHAAARVFEDAQARRGQLRGGDENRECHVVSLLFSAGR
ncbi:hypothetical protein D3C71_1779030 [compost metagenome]